MLKSENRQGMSNSLFLNAPPTIIIHNRQKCNNSNTNNSNNSNNDNNNNSNNNNYFELKNSWGADGAPQTPTTC